MYLTFKEEIYERVCLYLLQKFSISLINHVWELGALKQTTQRLKGCLHKKTRTGASFEPGWLFDLASRLHDDWVISYVVMWRYTVFMLIKYMCDSKSQTLLMRYPFRSTGRCLVVLHLHDIFARFRTGVTFSPRYNNWSELTPGGARVATAWHLVVVSGKQM